MVVFLCRCAMRVTIEKPVTDIPVCEFLADQLVKCNTVTGQDKGNKTGDRLSSLLFAHDEYLCQVRAEDNRVTGEANPRHLERVTKGSEFILDMILDIYENDDEKKLLNTLKLGFEILKKDYLGGNGTRGYGKIDIKNLKKTYITFKPDGKVELSSPEDFTNDTTK